MSEQARALYLRWKEQHASSRSESGQPRQQPGRPLSPPRSTATGRGTARCQPVQGTDVVLGTEEVTGAPVLLPYARRPEHLTIVGSTGTGKTTLLERLIRQDIVDGTACVVFDVHGDMTKNLLRFVSTQPAWAARTLLVDLTDDDPPFGANLYECPDPTLQDAKLVERTAAGVLAYLQRFWGEDLKARAVIARGLRNTTYTIIANPGYTMAEVPLLFSDKALRARLLARVRNPLVHAYWQAYDRLTRELDREMWRDSLINKLEQFLENEVTYPVLSQEHSTIPWEEILSNGYCLLIRLPLSAGEQSMEYLNALLLNQLARHLAARAGTTDLKNRPRVHLYLDEYRRLASEQTTTLLYEARKANVGVTVAMQSLEDLESKVARDATLQTATRIAFRTTAEVAKAVATTFAPAPNQVPVKKGICQSPVDYLVSHTHPNPAVRALVQEVLMSHIGDVSDNFGVYIPWGKISPASGDLSSALERLNKLLVDVMEGRLKPGSGELVYEILQVLLNRFYHYPGGVDFYIATTTTGALLTPGSQEAQYVRSQLSRPTYSLRRFLGNKNKWDADNTYLAVDFSSLCLDGHQTCLTLITAKTFGITGAAVHAGEREAEKRLHERVRKNWQGLRSLYPELSFSDELAKEKGNPYSFDYWDVHVSVVLTAAQRKAITDFCRQTFLDSDDVKKSDEALRKRYPKEFRFLTAVHQLCVLLAKEPIEVPAGPQEERQQTTADVINEVERQLTQLNNWEAYHALLQEDGTIDTDKIKMLPAPPLPPEDPALIEKIRHRSRQRFSRPRAEIDAATLRRQDTTATTPPSPQPSQTPQPPGTGARTPPPAARPKPRQPRQPRQPPPDPDLGPPPIGRR